MSPHFFAPDWCGLSWTEWIPLHASNTVYRKIPVESGVYRVRVTNRELISYIGQTRMGLRPRLRMLMRATYGTTMPFNDPHTAGPMHWLLRSEEGMEFECSAAPTNASDQERQVIEDMLLWLYRVQKGASTLANYGRFHACYERPSNRSQGRAMRRLPAGEPNPASGSSTTPLQLHGKPTDPDWMMLSWSDLAPLHRSQTAEIPPGQGLYKMVDAKTGNLLYIGESSQIRQRLTSHANKTWAHQALVAYHLLPNNTLAYQRHELEVDLIGAYYFETQQPPQFQYLA